MTSSGRRVPAVGWPSVAMLLWAAFSVSVSTTSQAEEVKAEAKDRYVVALRARTGALVWENRAVLVSRAGFSAYKRELVVHAMKPGRDKLIHVALDLGSGAFIDALGERRGRVLSTSRHLGPQLVRFSNGWELVRFDKGFDSTFRFVNHRGERVWNLHTGVHPDQPVAIDRTIFWNEGSYSGSSRVHAQRLGAKRGLWMADLGKVLGDEPPGEVQLHRLGSDLYVQTAGQLVQLNTRTGAVVRHWDFRPFLTGPGASGVVGLGTVSRDADTLVVAYPRKLFAIDRATGQQLWRMNPKSFPSRSGVLVHHGLVFMVRGEEKLPPAQDHWIPEG